MPDGLALNSSTFTVAGTPLENGSFYPIFQFNDSAGNSTQGLFGFTISDGASTLLINQNFQLGTSTVGTFYSFQTPRMLRSPAIYGRSPEEPFLQA